VIATAAATAAALPFHRHRFRRQGLLRGPHHDPDRGARDRARRSMLLLFAAASVRLGFATIVLAHVGFTVSYAFVVVKARIVASTRASRRRRWTSAPRPPDVLQGDAPRHLPGGDGRRPPRLRALDRRLRGDLLRGRGRATTLPLQIYSMVKSGISPEINAVSTMLLIATALSSSPRSSSSRGGPSAPPSPGGRRPPRPRRAVRDGRPGRSRGTLAHPQPLHLVELHLADTVRSSRPASARRSTSTLRLERGAPREAAGGQTPATTSSARRTTPCRCFWRRAAAPLDRSLLPHLANIDPSFLDRPYDPGNAHSGAVLLGHHRDRLRPAEGEGAGRLVGRAVGPRYAGGCSCWTTPARP